MPVACPALDFQVDNIPDTKNYELSALCLFVCCFSTNKKILFASQNRFKNGCWHFGTVMVNLHCAYAWIWNHHGNIPLHFPLRAFPDRFSWERRSILSVKDAISWTDPPMKKGKASWALSSRTLISWLWTLSRRPPPTPPTTPSQASHSAASHSSTVVLEGSYIFPGAVLKAGFPTWARSRWSSVQLSLKGSPIPSAN